ncbi:molybdopterin molybdochelatase [Aliiruegeria haliotis]|uniref:Molybdopterin molybdenumtransferase n=1 Tax=Aliiruegeria haliotis TaxID=1280846 RepID=A0A2T0RPS1_9RHOB|nr:molybdopterin-binding protein [Aliiruegeria haliotis]PRY23093.1 molybdopterin molybdochelatase [Aliiruegeria haliotis]
MIKPPKLRNDCFALPPGVDWVPMDDALDRMRSRVRAVVGTESVPVDACAGRILAEDVVARRSNPPAPNSAVDGYAFAGPAPDGPVTLPLAEGRAAAGVPFDGAVPAGHAIRILTGAILPPGVDTVVLQEDTAADDRDVALNGPLKRGANARNAGEDVQEGARILSSGRRLRPAEVALLSAVGISEVAVFKRLRVGVLSNGDEVVPPGMVPPEAMAAGAIYDANRPMLLAQIALWGFEPVDLGVAPDRIDGLREKLDGANVDAILTSGGVSTGDEDHVSALLRAEGHMETWRIAIKPGRPLALAVWQGTPVFGLPGNPVAALVCTLVFARPALEALAGGQWLEPQGFDLPAGFCKTKKPGRSEFLRARIGADGRVETFHSEGSGRISGLSWADGLVHLDEAPRQISPGDRVRFLPYRSFDG